MLMLYAGCWLRRLCPVEYEPVPREYEPVIRENESVWR